MAATGLCGDRDRNKTERDFGRDLQKLDIIGGHASGEIVEPPVATALMLRLDPAAVALSHERLLVLERACEGVAVEGGLSQQPLGRLLQLRQDEIRLSLACATTEKCVHKEERQENTRRKT